MQKGWIGVDLDGTLAVYHGWKGATHIGEPVLPMVKRVREWIVMGNDVRIFTARAFPIGVKPNADDPTFEVRLAEATRAVAAIEGWCRVHFGFVLPITCIKDYSMIQLWDDRAVQVVMNTGKPIEEAA